MSPFVLLVLLPTAILGKRVRCPLGDLPEEADEFRCCGVDSATRYYITGGTKTIPGQYPWMAGLEYLSMGNYSIFCGGSLISGRYVLTAAHCIKDKSLGEPHAVRLGEYDITHEGPDCIYNNRLQSCTDGERTILIHSHKCHKDYRPGTGYKPPVHDIALIRLRETVQFTNFIRPICLPTTDINDLGSDIKLYTAGWGSTLNKNVKSNILRHADMPLTDIHDCLKALHVTARDHRIVCAGGVTDRDTCKGDSGGPLMSLEDGRYYLVGVTSFGSAKCDNGLPAGFTNVFRYKQWIEQKIRNWGQQLQYDFK